jgi:thiol-disulfide isomerase/thioredoxin
MNVRLFVLALVIWSVTGCNRPAHDRTATANVERTPEAVSSVALTSRERPDLQIQFDTACSRARREHRRVLIQWADSQAPWSVVLEHQLRTDGVAATVVSYHCLFIPVYMDKGAGASELASRLGIDLPKDSLPQLSIVESDGKPIATTSSVDFRWSGKLDEGYDPDRLADWVLKYKVDCPSADAALAQAQKEEAGSGKPIFLHICAPYCGPCRMLDAWLARPDVAAIFDANFIDCPIDLERTPGAKDLYKRFSPKLAGISWIAYLDAKGTVLAKCIGFPGNGDDNREFIAAISASDPSLSAKDIEVLRSSFKRPSVASTKK